MKVNYLLRVASSQGDHGRQLEQFTPGVYFSRQEKRTATVIAKIN